MDAHARCQYIAWRLKMEGPFDNFPVEAVKGCRYYGSDSGVSFEGTIADVVVSGNSISFLHPDGGEAFQFMSGWGSWYPRGGDIEIDIRMLGSYVIVGVYPTR